ncbi:MAG: hypothetical protein KDD01_05185 [Phaeodactylibacter sp.]|nr:hypothetical protein [Phaeodactylibacter sp.]MCB0613303.1 hypothetical protein [Phaeodactylibacter sp.]
MESIIITIIWAAVIQGLFLGMIFITSKKHRSFANKLLGFFLLAFVFQAMIGLTIINILLFLIDEATLLDVLGWELMEAFYMSFQYYAFFLTVAVFVIALMETQRYRNLVKNEYSDSALLNINWLWQFIFLIAPIIIIWGIELVRIAMGGRGQSELITLLFLFIALFNYFVDYKAFKKKTGKSPGQCRTT